MLVRPIKSIFIVGCLISLSGCAKKQVVEYNPQDFINPNRVVTKSVRVHVPQPVVNATFGYGNNPEVVKAYEKFSKTGKASNIQSKGFNTFAYDAYSHPIVACEPLHLCVVQLERGERINNINLGDSAHWLVATSLVGSAQDGSYQIAIKPKQYNIATDMIVTTNKRTYNIGLVSKRGSYTHVTTFYYPEESLNYAIKAAHTQETAPLRRETVSSNSHVDINHINFNYQMRGDYPAWRPSRIFDDGTKTYIRMPPISERLDLPVLYILRKSKMQLINYRYKRPYYVIDGLFKRAVLVSGKGSDQAKVIIKNKNFA